MKTTGWTNEMPFTATEDDCRAGWSGGKEGKHFKCGLCGYRFAAGDTVRWQYTNDVQGAGGNPLVCVNCDGSKEKIVEKIIGLNELKRRMGWTDQRD